MLELRILQAKMLIESQNFNKAIYLIVQIKQDSSRFKLRSFYIHA